MNLDKNNWLVRLRGDDEVHAIRRHVTPIVSERSKHQLIEIVETYRFGKALALDGVYQSSEFDEAIYHESLVHPAMSLFFEQPLRVLIIGGGEGCVAREVFRHRNVRSVDMLELDDRVTALCHQHLGWDEGAIDNPILSLHFGDASRVLPNLPSDKTFDVIIVDSTQPVGGSVAGPLAGENFLLELRRRLNPLGCLVGYGINAALIGADLRSEIRRKTLASFGGKLIEYVVPCPFYSASFAFQLWLPSSYQNPKAQILSQFSASGIAGLRAIDATSVESYFAIPAGYRISL